MTAFLDDTSTPTGPPLLSARYVLALYPEEDDRYAEFGFTGGAEVASYRVVGWATILTMDHRTNISSVDVEPVVHVPGHCDMPSSDVDEGTGLRLLRVVHHGDDT